MKKIGFVFIAVAFFAALLVGSVAPVALGDTISGVWDVTDDFSVNNGNPNGQWSYGRYDSATDGAVFSLLTVTGDSEWLGSENICQVWKNTGTTTVCGVEPGQVSLHPGKSGDSNYIPVAVRWTAETAGVYDVVGEFFSGDPGVVSVGIVINGEWSSLAWSASDYGSFDLELSLSAGDTVDFVVYNGYWSGNTPLEATITAVPEPGTMSMLLGGLLGLIAYAWRKRA